MQTDDTNKILVETVKRYVRERLVPLEGKITADDSIPPEVLQEFRDMGLFGLSTPSQYGGLGLSCAQEVEITFEFCWASPAFRAILSNNLGLGSQGILLDGTEEQRLEWLPRIASGEIITSFCLTESEAGSDSSALQTTAVRDGGDYILNGSKCYITNAPMAGLFIVMARTAPERLPKNAHISAFLIPAITPGVSTGQPEPKMGQQGSWISDVYFEDVRVPASSIIGGVEGRGFATAMKSINRGRINVASVATGQARRALYEAARYAGERKQFGEPIGNYQLVQAMLADSKADLYAGESMVRDVARRSDAGESIITEAACAKMFCSEMAWRIADRTVQIFGGSGYVRTSIAERLLRDARVFRLYEGTTQIQQLLIGRDVVRQAANA